MTTYVVPWRGDKPTLLECSLMTALESFQPDDVLVIGGFEEKAYQAFSEARTWSGWPAGFRWLPNPLEYTHAPLPKTDAAMRVACRDVEVSEPFVWGADDLFWPSPRSYGQVLLDSVLNMQNWVLGPAATSPRLGQGLHGRALAESLAVLEVELIHDGTLFDFEGHWPLAVHKATMLEALAMAPKGQKRTTYGNLRLDRWAFHTEPEVHEDIKVFRGVDLPVTRDRFVSTGSAVTEREVARWLKR